MAGDEEASTRFDPEGAGFSVWGLGFRALGFRVKGLGFRVFGLGDSGSLEPWRVGCSIDHQMRSTCFHVPGNGRRQRLWSSDRHVVYGHVVLSHIVWAWSVFCNMPS